MATQSYPGGDFEDASYWTLEGKASIASKYGSHGGAKALVMQIDQTNNSTATSVQTLATVAGLTYPVAFWVYLDRADYAYDLGIDIDYGGGYQTLGTYTTAEFDLDTWTLEEVEFTALDSYARIRFTSSEHNPLELATTRWLVDDILIGAEVITSTIYDAMITDLQDIDGTGIFSSTVASVTGNDEDLAKLPTPAVSIVSGGGGEADPAALANQTGVVDQRWNIRARVRSATPNTDIYTLLDDIRNALERTTSNVHAVSGVEWCVVESWPDRLRTSEDLEGQWGEIDCIALVRYYYTRGSA